MNSHYPNYSDIKHIFSLVTGHARAQLIFPDKVAKAYNQSAIELAKMKQNGISARARGKIKQYVRRNKEAGVKNTPRFNYKLS